MAGQTWLAYTFAGVMLATAAYCLARLVISWRQRRRTDRQADAVHVLMGVAMAGMLVPALRVFWAGGWEVIFAGTTAWFGWLAVREHRNRAALGRSHPHHAQHALGCAAMVYMLAAAGPAGRAAAGAGTGASGMGGGGARFSTLALVFAVVLLGYVVVTADRLPALARVGAVAAAGPGAGGPGAAAGPGAAGPGADVGSGAGWGTPLSPRLAACCEIAMGVTMGYALILML